jgi:hypothetical protein
VPLADATVVHNTCPDPSSSTGAQGANDFCNNGNQRLALYFNVDLGSHMPINIPSPNANHAGATRRVSAKGLRGAEIVSVASGGAAALEAPAVGGGGDGTITFSSQAAIMDAMPHNTNCFPGSIRGSCVLATGGATPAITYADGRFESTTCQCTAPHVQTPCVKMFVNEAPVRFLLFLNAVQPHTYNGAAGEWAATPGTDAQRILYFRHGATSGVAVPNSSPCFPYGSCDGITEAFNEDSSGGYTPSWNAWIVLLIAAVVIAACILVAMRHGGELSSARTLLRDAKRLRDSARAKAQHAWHELAPHQRAAILDGRGGAAPV